MRHRSRGVATLAAAALLVTAGCDARRTGDASRQASFGTPDEATTALVTALEQHDRAALQRLFGPETEELIGSGDSAAYRRDRDAFLARYRAHHQLVAGGPDDVVLQVGDDDWPFPVPILQRGGRWRFDGDAAVRELRLRRIGANELRTIDVLRGVVAAQREYAAVGHDGNPPGVYARVLWSDPGRQNGLYWPVAAGGRPSPAGPYLAAASAEGRRSAGGAPVPYHGYVYRLLFAQGPSATGGARDYVANGLLTGGFALIARPAAYPDSGVMTFIVNQDGVVWQRDLGDSTAARAAAIEKFDPDSAWTPLPAEEDAAGDSTRTSP